MGVCGSPGFPDSRRRAGLRGGTVWVWQQMPEGLELPARGFGARGGGSAVRGWGGSDGSDLPPHP